ncbi:hypothetical protein [Natronococcus wangiae]|uniref:hypothetical protein n=1 Tax=Natronococcus wangiae TaxID=3068275 RepID=UPI00273D692A|nr:hypothetical protein [Natronococcus sp. AD5]
MEPCFEVLRRLIDDGVDISTDAPAGREWAQSVYDGYRAGARPVESQQPLE